MINWPNMRSMSVTISLALILWNSLIYTILKPQKWRHKPSQSSQRILAYGSYFCTGLQNSKKVTMEPGNGGTRGGTCYVGVPGDVPFSWVYFLLGNSKAGYQFWRKILKQGNILLGNRPNFFVERLTWSQNQSYCLKSRKISINKITENVGKFQN